jgi:hypothetical protein
MFLPLQTSSFLSVVPREKSWQESPHPNFGHVWLIPEVLSSLILQAFPAPADKKGEPFLALEAECYVHFVCSHGAARFHF